jgi:hypothetical protein
MKVLTIFFITLLSLKCYSQIDVREKEMENPLKKMEEKINSIPYDSLYNSPGLNLGGFIGQRLLMNKINNNKYNNEFDKKTYNGFYTNIKSEPYSVYKGIVSNNYSKNTKTDINAVYGKYFMYLGYEITKVNSSYSDKFNIYLKLLDENNDTIYFEYLLNLSPYLIDYNENFPFITEGYYIKSIKELKDKKVRQGFFLYTCLDVFVEENSDDLKFKLLNSNGEIEYFENSKYSKIRGFKQFKFEYDSTYLYEDKSTFKAMIKNKLEGGLYIFSKGINIYITLYFSPNNCFSMDDIIELKFGGNKIINEYFRGKDNCNGVVKIALDITNEKHIDWIEKLVSENLQSVLIKSITNDQIFFSPKDYENIKYCIKAHYMNLLK